MTTDLRAYLAQLRAEHPDELLEIDTPVSAQFDMTACALELENAGRAPVLLFNNVTGHDKPVVCNVFSNRKRIARMIGLEERDLATGWARVAARRVPPTPAASAPAQEVVLEGAAVDLGRFPIPVHFEGDAGPYVTGGVVVARDPDTGAGNLSFARMQVKGPDVFGASLHSRGDLWNYERRAALADKPLEVAIVIGAHPAVTLAAAARLPAGDDELELAGGLLGQPVPVTRARTVDLQVPAEAEMVIEGVVEPGAQADEGPFGEFTGYASGRSTRHVVRVRAITHRRDMIYQDVVPGKLAEHLNLSKTPRVGNLFEIVKRRFPAVVDMNFPSSGTHFHCYISVRKTMEGMPKQLMMLLFGLEMFLKLVVVVDADIDVYDEAQVMWSLATRFQADRDLFIVPNVACNLLDPSAHDGLAAKMGLDATMPQGATEKALSFSDEVLARVRRDILQGR